MFVAPAKLMVLPRWSTAILSRRYKFFIADYLPKVPYLTRLDWYIWGCLALLVLIVGESGLINFSMQQSEYNFGQDENETWVQDEEWYNLERQWFSALFLFWIFWNVGFFYLAFRHQYRSNTMCGLKIKPGTSWFKGGKDGAEVLEQADDRGDVQRRAKFLIAEDRNNAEARKHDKYFSSSKSKRRNTLRLRREQALEKLQVMEDQEVGLHKEIVAAKNVKNFALAAELENKRWFNYCPNGKPQPHFKTVGRKDPKAPEPQIISLIKSQKMMNKLGVTVPLLKDSGLNFTTMKRLYNNGSGTSTLLDILKSIGITDPAAHITLLSGIQKSLQTQRQAEKQVDIVALQGSATYLMIEMFDKRGGKLEERGVRKNAKGKYAGILMRADDLLIHVLEYRQFLIANREKMLDEQNAKSNSKYFTNLGNVTMAKVMLSKCTRICRHVAMNVCYAHTLAWMCGYCINFTMLTRARTHSVF